MPLPANFNYFEHFQSVYRMIQNRDVQEEFSDVTDDDDITLPRSSLKVACTIRDIDTADIMLLKSMLFQRVQGPKAYVYSDISRVSSRRKYKPKVRLYFLEDLADVADGYNAVDGEIGFRIMEAGTDNDITQSQALALANKIKIEFGTGNGFVWRKGKYLYSYTDWDKGYQLQILCRDKPEGKQMVEKTLSIQGDSPIWKYGNFIEPEEPTTRYPTLPSFKPVLGKTQRLPRERPIADVRFQFATLSILGMKEPIILYSRTLAVRGGLVS